MNDYGFTEDARAALRKVLDLDISDAMKLEMIEQEVRPGGSQRINAKCSWCGEPMPVPTREQGGGRTKLYCRPAHKQAAHRAAQRPDRRE